MTDTAEDEPKTIEETLNNEEKKRFKQLLNSIPEAGVQGLDPTEVLAYLIKVHPKNSQGFQDDMERWLTDRLELPIWEKASRKHKPNPKTVITPEGTTATAPGKKDQRQPTADRGGRQRGGRKDGRAKPDGKPQQPPKGRDKASNKPEKASSKPQDKSMPSAQAPKGRGPRQNPQQKPQKTDTEATTKVVQQPKGVWGDKPLQQILQEKQQQQQRPPAPPQPQQEENVGPAAHAENGQQRPGNNKHRSRGGKRGKQKADVEEPRQTGTVEHSGAESSTPSSELEQNPQPVDIPRQQPQSANVAGSQNVAPQEQKLRLGEVEDAPESGFSFGLDAQPPQESSAPTQRLNFGSIESIAKPDIKFGVQEDETVTYEAEAEVAQDGIRNLSVTSGTQEEVRFAPGEQKVTQVQDFEAETIAQAHAQAQAEEQRRKEHEQELYEQNGDARQRRHHNGRQQQQQTQHNDNRRGGGGRGRNSGGRGRGAKNQGHGGRGNEATSSGMTPGMPNNMMGMDVGNYNMYGGQMPPVPMGMGDFSGMGPFMGGPMPVHGAPMNDQGYYGSFPMQNFYPASSGSLQSTGPSSSGAMHTNEAPTQEPNAPASAPPGIAAERGFPPMGQNFGNQPPSQGTHAGQKGVQHQQPQNFAAYNHNFNTYSGYQNPYAFPIPGSMAMNPQGAFFANHNAFSMQPQPQQPQQSQSAAQGIPAQSPPRSQQPQNFFPQQSGPPGLKGGQFGFPGVAANQQMPMPQQPPVNRDSVDYNNAFVAQGASSGLDNNQPAGIHNGYEFTNAPQRGGPGNAFGNPTEFGGYTVPQSSSLPQGNSWYTQ